MKKGQITLFIIVGIILILVIGLGIYFKGAIKDSLATQKMTSASLPPEVRSYWDHVYSCLEDTSKTGLVNLGLQGGYAESPDNALETDEVDIAYWYQEGEKTAPSIKQIEQSFASFIETYLPLCIDNSKFTEFTEITSSEPIANVEIEEESLSIKLQQTTTFASLDDIYEIDTPYEIEYDVKLGKIYDIADSIVDQELADPENMDIDLLLETGMDIDILPIDDANTVYVITDQASMIGEEPYSLMFANKFEEVA